MLEEIKQVILLILKANGKRAMKLDNNDKLIQVLLVGDDNDIILSTSKGKCKI